MNMTARLAAFSACFLWAISFIATKEALQTVPPLTVVTLRLVIAALCFLVCMLARPMSSASTKQAWWRFDRRSFFVLAGLSTVGTGLHYGSQTIGLQFTTASNASLYAVTAPITIVILAWVFLGEPISRLKLCGITVAVIGVLTVMGWKTLMALELTSHIIGDLLVMASIIMWGIFTVFGKKITDDLGARRVIAVVTIIGATWMLPIGWAESRALAFSLLSIPVTSWIAIIFLGAGCCFVATLLYFVALEQSESQKVGAYLYTIPPMTAVVAALYLGETLSVSFFAGSALVLVGVFLTERG